MNHSLSQLINFNRRLLSTEHSSFQSSEDESAVFNDGGSEGSASEAFKTQFQDLFNLRSVTHSAIQSFLTRFNSHCIEQEVEGRIIPDPTFALSVSHLSRFNSHFTPSEILLQRLACKCSWTESELSRVIDLLHNPLFNAGDVGLDVTRKVGCTLQIIILRHIVSCQFMSFHINSY